MNQKGTSNRPHYTIWQARLLFSVSMTLLLVAAAYISQIIGLLLHHTTLGLVNLALLSEHFVHEWLLVGVPIFLLGFFLMSFIMPQFKKLRPP